MSGAGVSSDSSDQAEALEDTSDDEKDLNLEDSDSAVEETTGAESKGLDDRPDTVKEKCVSRIHFGVATFGPCCDMQA